jgi:hypothetical protein
MASTKTTIDAGSQEPNLEKELPIPRVPNLPRALAFGPPLGAWDCDRGTPEGEDEGMESRALPGYV